MRGFRNICVTNDNGYVPLVVNTSRSFPHSLLITGVITRLTRRVQLVEQFTPSFSGVHVTRSLVLCVFFVDCFLSFLFWPLCCLSFFDLRILITPLVSSNSSYNNTVHTVICEGCHFTHMWKALAWSHHFTKRTCLIP